MDDDLVHAFADLAEDLELSSDPDDEDFDEDDFDLEDYSDERDRTRSRGTRCIQQRYRRHRPGQHPPAHRRPWRSRAGTGARGDAVGMKPATLGRALILNGAARILQEDAADAPAPNGSTPNARLSLTA